MTCVNVERRRVFCCCWWRHNSCWALYSDCNIFEYSRCYDHLIYQPNACLSFSPTAADTGTWREADWTWINCLHNHHCAALLHLRSVGSLCVEDPQSWRCQNQRWGTRVTWLDSSGTPVESGDSSPVELESHDSTLVTVDSTGTRVVNLRTSDLLD